MADDEVPDNATVQMSADQIKKLHAELQAAQKRNAMAAAAAQEPQVSRTKATAHALSAAEAQAQEEQHYTEEGAPAPEEGAEHAEADYDQAAYAGEEAPAEEYAEEAPAEEYAEEAPAEEYAEEAPAEEYAEEAPAEEAAEEAEPAPDPKAAKAAQLEKAKADKAAADKAKADKAAADKAKAEKAKAEKAAKADKAVKPAAAPSEGGGAMLILGGIGALIAGLSICLPILSQLQGMTGEQWPMLGGLIGMSVGHLLLMLGMFGAVSRTNGVAALVGVLHLLAVAGLAFFLLVALYVIPLEDNDIIPYILLIPGILPGTAWLLSAIWGLSSGAGAMGVLHGVFAFIGGGALITMQVLALAGEVGGQDDLAIALDFGGRGAVLLGAVFLAIAMFGRLRRPA